MTGSLMTFWFLLMLSERYSTCSDVVENHLLSLSAEVSLTVKELSVFMFKTNGEVI